MKNVKIVVMEIAARDFEVNDIENEFLNSNIAQLGLCCLGVSKRKLTPKEAKLIKNTVPEDVLND